MRMVMLLGVFLFCVGVQVHGTPPVYKAPVLVPAYGPSYSPSEDFLKQILEELRGVRQELREIKGVMGGAPQGQEGALAVLSKRCASCHTDPAQKGDGFVLVEKDGVLAEFSLAEKRRIIRLVQKGDMPPSGKLPAEEVQLIEDFFNPEKGNNP